MGVDRVTQYGNLTGFQQGFLLAILEDSRKEVKRRKVMQTAIKAVAVCYKISKCLEFSRNLSVILLISNLIPRESENIF